MKSYKPSWRESSPSEISVSRLADLDRAGFVAWLAGVRVETGVSEEVGGAFVHGEEDLGRADAGGEVGLGLQASTPGDDLDGITVLNS